MTATKGMTMDQALALKANDRVRDITCGREGIVTTRFLDGVQVIWDRERPDGGEWLGKDSSWIPAHESDFLEKIEAE